MNQELDRKTRKLLTMHKGLHSNSDVDGLLRWQERYVSRRLYVRGLVSCESTIRSEENNLGWYLKNSNENLLQGVHVRILKFRACLKERL